MLKNDVLLRAILLAVFFFITRPFFELLSFIFVPYAEFNKWFGIIGAATFSFFFQGIVHDKIQKSVRRNGSVTTTIKWGLYILTGLMIFFLLIYAADSYFYESYSSIKMTIFQGEFLERLKSTALFIIICYISYKSTRIIVGKVCELSAPSPTILQQQFNLVPQSQPVQIQPESNYLNVKMRQKGDKETIHGSAKFLDNHEFNKRYNNKTDEEMYQQFEDYGGYVIVPNVVRYIDHTHRITIAGAGQGKGTCAIIPDLLTKPKESWIVLDVKGENAAVTARFQEQSGQKVYILDPFGVQTFIEAKHHINPKGYNPLVVAKYLPDEEVSDFAAMISEMFIPEANKSSSSENFFIDTARNILKTYILHIITEESLHKRHLGLLYEWLRLDQEKEIDLWVDIIANPHTTFGGNEIKSLAVKSDKTWIGVLSEMRRATSFLESPLIRKSLESDDFDPMMLQRTGATVYVILPERNLNTHKAWLRLVFGTTLKLCNFIAKRRVNFLMDEFPILGRMDDFLRAFAFGRGQKISCWIIAQSLSQLKEIYGEDGLNTFLSNAKLRQFFGMNDYYTQKYVSDLLGMTTEITRTNNRGVSTGTSVGTSNSYSSFAAGSSNEGSNSGTNMGDTEQLIQRPLLSTEEVGNLKDEFIILIDGEKYKFPKIYYYKEGIYPGRFDPNPYVGE